MPKPTPKTHPTTASIPAYLASRASPQQLADCKTLIALCKRITKKSPKMWGPSIVGFGAYSYTYPSGHSGTAPLLGFAIRGTNLVLYLLAHTPAQSALLAKLGKHKMTKACLYFKSLADLDPKILESLITNSITETQRLYPNPPKT